MEKVKSRQRRKKEKSRAYNIDRQVPDAPTMEEFECLLGESPTNYPRVEGIANMESELHSAAIDTSIYEKETVSYKEDQEDVINVSSIQSVISIDEVDTTELPESLPCSSSPAAEEVETTFTSGKIEIDLQQTEKTLEKIEALDLNPNQDLNQLQKDLTQLQKDLDQSQKNLEQSQKDFLPDSNLIASSSTNFLHQEVSQKPLKSKIQPFTDAQLSSLYSNAELSHLDAFINDFIDSQLRESSSRQHRLHELLMSYLRVRNHLTMNSVELENLKKSCKEVQKQLWHLDKASITESGECEDGNPVNASHEYTIAHFNQQSLVPLTKNLSSIKELLHNCQVLYCYEAEVLKLQIEHYIQRVSTSCHEFASLTQNAAICLMTHQEQETKSAPVAELTELRTCITILFNFQRRVLKDGKFVLESRQWLSRLVAVLLRVATWQDHLFILNHVLRCPGGVTKWAAGLVQVPTTWNQSRGVLSTSTLQDPYLDHMVVSLAVMLLPIKDREKFLEQVQISLQEASNPGDTIWVMLDAEGEEDEDISAAASLFESDLINLLNQIPIDKLFSQVLLIEETDSGFVQDTKGITEQHMLRVIAFAITLLRLFRQGLRTYDSPRYRQLAKRLSALIRDCVQYVSDQWELFDKSADRSTTIERLQLEYDWFFIRATMCVFSSRRLGAWQYLAAIPYHLISSSALWNIFYCLHKVQDNEDLQQVDCLSDWEADSSGILKQFEEKLIEMPGDESYFLLTTFANMAMARSFKDYDFIRATTIDLFRIGFLSEKTQESCSKDARSLLSNLTSKYPALLSDILLKLRDNFVSVGKLSLYLFTELSIGKWIPREEDLGILSGWLHNFGLGSTESHLARLILTHLNWGLDRNGDLYLPQHLHYRIAVLIVELMIKYVPETPGQSTSLLESVKNVSAIVRPQNNEQAFSLWAWEMVTRLRLHATDTTESSCRNAIVNPAEAFFHVPDVEADPTMEVLVKGVREKQPIACWVVVLMTQWGHSVPLICSKGFAQLSILQCFYKYEQILIALHCLVPLFIDCADSLYKNERFCGLVNSLVMADRTYVKMAKNLIAPEFPGPIMRQFGWMIESNMINFKRYFHVFRRLKKKDFLIIFPKEVLYCLSSPEPLIQLWLNILVRIPDWNRDNNVMYLMDIIIRAAFFHLDARKTTENIFQTLYTLSFEGTNENLGSSKSTNSIGSFLNWATGTGSSASLLDGSTSSTWLAYLILFTEQQMRELKTGLWRELLRELSSSKTTVDSALKRVCSTLKIPYQNSNSLAIYRWSQQALDTPLEHPLLPLLWQNFFTLFLARIPVAGVDLGGLGDKFFEGMINLSYLKKLKKRLNETTEYFQVKGENNLDNGHPITDEQRVFYFSTAKFYKTLSLWLEEPRLQETGLYLPALPPQYMSQKLIILMQAEYENLLIKAGQPPPSKFTQGCVFMDHLIALLEHELNLHRTCENTAVLTDLQATGVRLFYHLVEVYSEEAALYLPTKQLITTCVEKLGQLFISGEESQGPRLLSTIIQRPTLGGLLGPHFTPVAGGAANFLAMYSTVVDLSSSSNADLCFVLLSKFDVGAWLNYRRPRLSERSTFIELVSKALCNIGLNPEDDKLILHELFRNHLRAVLLHEFPEHYGEVLGAILRGSEGQNLSLDVWRDLLAALSGRSRNLVVHPCKVREEIRRYATEQRLLSRQEIHDTAVLLSKHFMKERLQYGLYGLYPKYRVYNEPLNMFLGMVGHALVVLTLQFDRGSLADQLCERIWPVLSDMFAPWITPYWTRNLQEPTAAWIQQLTDDRSVLLPWIISDGPYANKTVAVFVECIRFIIDTMPASCKILGYLWQFYVTNFANASIKDHVLNVIHGNFFHLFLGNIFVMINWTTWINDILATQPIAVAGRMHVCLLNLIVKLSNEPNVRQNERAILLVTEAEKFAWHLVDATVYDQVVNWHVMSSDPRVILNLGFGQVHTVDVAVNNLLKIVAAYDATATHFHPTTLKKRQIYVRSAVKLLVNCTTRHKSLVSSNAKAFAAAMGKMLEEMEIIVTSTVWCGWLADKTAASPVLLGMLRVIGISVTSPATLGEIMEAALESYFRHSITEDVEPSWGSVLGILQPVVPRQPPIESVLVAEGRLLALYALLMKRLPSCRDIREEGMMLVNLVDWITAIKPSEIIEEKIPLLSAKAFELAYRQCQYNENTTIAARSLKRLARALLAVADDAGQGWGIFGAIGIRKGSQLSIRCKFLSRVLGTYCFAQLPDSKSEQQIVRFTPHAPGVAPARSIDLDTIDVRPSPDVLKGLQALENLLTNKQYGELKGDIEKAIKLICDSANSLHNAVNIVGLLTTELYHEKYLHVLTE
ncbi:GSCOCG00000476001-RA-CDS [Cotesia congregata]|nr:GSCOCG00000476001-RA-CDS [Cotesia congregata]